MHTHSRARRVGGGLVLGVLLAALARAVTPPGLVFEAEDVAEPKSAWLLNRATPDHWRLWTEEQDIEQKRSRRAVMASPTVAKDRTSPEEGAPPLHCVVTALEPGAYRVFVSGPGRPLAYSLDNQTWTRYQGGELDLGVRDVTAGRFEIWIDDRYAHPPENPGPGYFDYIRFLLLPKGALQVTRWNPWPGLDTSCRDGQERWAVPAAQCQLDGFGAEPGQTIKAGGPPAAFSYTFPRQGRFHLGLVLVDAATTVEELAITLNGQELGVCVGDAPSGGRSLFTLNSPVTVRAGAAVVFKTLAPAVECRVEKLYVSTTPLLPPPPTIENVAVWCPAPGTVHLCWTTSAILEPGTVAYGTGGQLDQTLTIEGSGGRNHRAVLSGLDPTRDYAAQITTRADGKPIQSAAIAFRPRPPEPPATRPQTVELQVPEPTDSPRTNWPALVGLPFAHGSLAQATDLRLFDEAGRPLPLQTELFSCWPDGSVKLVTIGFPATTRAGAPSRYRLEARPDWPDPVPAVPDTLAVESTAAGWRLVSDCLTLDLAKAGPTPCANLGFDRNSDGRITDDERLPARPGTGGLTVVTEDGSALTAGPVTAFAVEQNGPVRAVVRCSGAMVDREGNPSWAYVLRLTLFHGQPQLLVNASVANDHPTPTYRRIRSWSLDVPLEAGSGVVGAFDGAAPAPLPPGGLSLCQERDNRFTSHSASGPVTGAHALGLATAADGQTRVCVFVRDFWQAYPTGFTIRPTGIRVDLLPPLPADVYRDADSLDSLKLFGWCRDGHYTVKAGQLAQKELAVRYGPVSDSLDPAAFAGWCAAPLLPQASAGYLCASGLLSRSLFPRTPGVWDRYEEFFEKGFLAQAQDVEKNRTYGWMHWGDWFGERILNYGNNEYDLPWAMAVQWARTGDRRYLDRGLSMARHHSTTDTLFGRLAEARSGLVYEHSFNHVGIDIDRDDPRLKEGLPARYMREFGAMLGGAIDPQGHVFEAGNWIYAALTGDGWLREVAERVSTNQAQKLTPRFDFSIERAGGWPLINMVMAYHFSGNPFYLNAARLMVERTLDRQDPVSGGWLHWHGGSESGGEQGLGGKAFAVAVLAHGLLRYLEHEPNPRPDVEAMLGRGADFLRDYAWVPGQGFRYISHLHYFDNRGGHGGVGLLNSELVAFAYEKTRDPKYLEFFRDMLQGQLDGSPGGNGKSYAMQVRQTVYGLDRIRPFGVVAAPRVTAVLLRDQAELVDGSATVRAVIENPGRSPRRATARVVSGAAPVEVAWDVPAESRCPSPELVLKAPASAEVAIEFAVEGTPPARKSLRLVAPRPLPGAHRGQGVAYIGPADHCTRRGLVASNLDLPLITDPATADLARYAGLIVASDSWKTKELGLPAAVGRLVEFVQAGGRVALFQLNDDSWDPAWLPCDLFVFDPDSALGEVATPTHPLFSGAGGVGAIAGAKLFDALGAVVAPWQVLARDVADQPAIIEAELGRGRLLVLQPSFDRYATGPGEAPDGNVAPATAQALLRNLIHYLGQQ